MNSSGIRRISSNSMKNCGDDMKLCLDTNAYSMLAEGRASLRARLELAVDIILPATVLGELYAGFAMGHHRQTHTEQLMDFLALPGVVVAKTTAEVAERYGLLVAALKEAGSPLPTNDIWIAATAMSLGAKLVTYDRHFEKIAGLLIVSP